WARSARELHHKTAAASTAQTLVSTLLVILLTIGFVSRGGSTPLILLLVMWSSRLPSFGQEISQSLVALRDLENVSARVLSPLGAGEVASSGVSRTRGAAHLVLDRVTAVAAGTEILRDVSLEIRPGAHVGVVGASGAGKSSLLSLLLGWIEPSRGSIRVDG